MESVLVCLCSVRLKLWPLWPDIHGGIVCRAEMAKRQHLINWQEMRTSGASGGALSPFRTPHESALLPPIMRLEDYVEWHMREAGVN
jgi:hypothetical protein